MKQQSCVDLVTSNADYISFDIPERQSAVAVSIDGRRVFGPLFDHERDQAIALCDNLLEMARRLPSKSSLERMKTEHPPHKKIRVSRDSTLHSIVKRIRTTKNNLVDHSLNLGPSPLWLLINARAAELADYMDSIAELLNSSEKKATRYFLP